MKNINAHAGVGVTGMAGTTLLAPAASAPVAHPAFAAHAAGAAAAITPQRKRRIATAIDASVDRGSL
ncbi:MAG: hypothetical protein JWR37_1413 [Mycobacterium sp.]|jgi:hypothetical protein|nr:hypothetical protein [Mycobacterium sp.]